MNANNGGSAFPIKEPLSSDALGMTLRDYFAAKAMQAYLAAGNSTIEDEKIARWSYANADAMLTERAK